MRRESAFSQPLFRRYFPSSCLATLGGWIIRFLLGWSAWELTHSALWVGVVAGLMLLPTFFLSPVFGIVADRINPRNGLIMTVCLQGLIALLAGVANSGGQFSLPWLLCMATLLGAASSAHTPIRLALIPRLVEREALPSAIGISAIIFNTSRIFGPAVGAWLLSNYSLSAAFYVAVMLFVGTLALLFTVRIEPRPIRLTSLSLLQQFREGLRYVRTRPAIKLVLAYTLV
ncbi:MAG: MFS transporter, partial [Halieaceae bacterium]